MSKVDVCTCMIKRDKYTTIHRDENRPMTYAQVEMMRFLFGDNNVTNVKVIGFREMTNQEQLVNLRLEYGVEEVGKAFPGTRPRLPLEAPDDTETVVKKDLIDFTARERTAHEEYQLRREENMTRGNELAAAKKAGVVAAE